ncbi:MAG: UDP-N-acetylglucosamine 2-epimerase (non-hydrolyzing) [Rhodospirillales bacterium CG15_BIG_FIL_POST_REV_8_21_14_020_66_15]|nr:MAG: UDP-N-acetylglucosamine 2-epimerase (non-hydrolyzing) [Rhodospirillales bacterium CG15_BIG_FIL_POST_REV_8_21_14_020_66_15]
MTRIATVVGARPQFIKAGPVSRAFEDAGIAEVLIHTGQHFDDGMSDVFFRELGLAAPDHHLGISGGGHGDMTGRMLIALEPVLMNDRPDGLLIYGDTNSTLAGALAAAKLDIPVFHVEAGLRSFRRAQPEEINRRVADHLSTLLFCPTPQAISNLAEEGISRGVMLVGDVMYDAALQAAGRPEGSDIVARLGLTAGEYEVATVHRAENTDDDATLAKVVDFLKARPGTVVLPLHPRTKAALARAGLTLDGVTVTEPLGYLEMTHLVKASAGVLTDSGGLQKEAYFHRVPCVTLRDETEWVETVEAGWNRLWQGPDFSRPRRDIDAYGDGGAATRIAQAIREFMAA